MKQNIEKVMDWVFIHEGGYAERDVEPGGAVNMGISFNAFKDAWKRLKKPGTPTFEDLKALKRGSATDSVDGDAEDIYYTWFFKPLEFEVLPSGVDYALLDFAVNSGVGGAIRCVKKKWKFPAVGKMDPKFLWALKSRDPIQTINDICDARLDLMRGLKAWAKFEANWTKRVNKVRERALAMAKENAHDN